LSESIQALPVVSPIEQMQQPQSFNQIKASDTNFRDTLKAAIDHISEIEHESNRKTDLLAEGKIEELHDVMITAQKASITIEASVQIQQKVIDAYNEMMRMQV